MRRIVTVACCIAVFWPAYLPSALGQSVSVRVPPLWELFPDGPPAVVPQPGSAAPDGMAQLAVEQMGVVTARQALRAKAVLLLDQSISPEDVTEIGMGLLNLSNSINWELLTSLAPEHELTLRRLRAVDEALAARQTSFPIGSGTNTAENDLALAQSQYLIARLKHETEMLRERGRVVKITNWISWFIFVIAHVILGVGLWAAVREFIHASEIRHEPPEQMGVTSTDVDHPGEVNGESSSAAPAQHSLTHQEIRVSLEGIALKTTLHGVLIFALAIGFYVLYLKFVYPVTVIGE